MKQWMDSRASLLFALCLVGACVDVPDPSRVNDLRVLAMKVEPPDILLPGCGTLLATDGGSLDAGLLPAWQAALAQSVTLTTLIADPDGGGRLLPYSIRACSYREDGGCHAADTSAALGGGVTGEGELKVELPSLGLTRADAGWLLQRAFDEDPYRGLGGLWLRLEVALSAPDGSNKIFAQKVMVYTCGFFDSQKANRNPAISQLTRNGNLWDASEVALLASASKTPIRLIVADGGYEPYVVPNFSLQAVNLTEIWSLDFFTTAGSFNRSDLEISATDPPGAARMFLVVRDGRGGESWLMRDFEVSAPAK